MVNAENARESESGTCYGWQARDNCVIEFRGGLVRAGFA
jgi:hypothetical protein